MLVFNLLQYPKLAITSCQIDLYQEMKKAVST